MKILKLFLVRSKRNYKIIGNVKGGTTMRFFDHYFKDNTFYMPIDFDLCSFNKHGKLEVGIPLKYLSELVKHDVIRLSHKGKTFKTLDEAYKYYDSLTEEEQIIEESVDKKKKPRKPSKYKTKITDPDTGEERNFEVASGNAKIGGDTVLLNMSTAGNCMSALIGTCELAADGRCYSLGFEKQWINSLRKNKRHEAQWACLSPRGLALGLSKILNNLPRVKFIRVNESGEFRNLPTNPEMLARVSDERKAQLAGVNDIEKLKRVADELAKIKEGITFYTYTHRTDLEFGEMGPHICLNGSGYMIDNAFIPLKLAEFNDVMDKVERKELKEFNGVPVRAAMPCKGDCRECNYCKKKTYKHIFLPIHGSGSQSQIELEKILSRVVSTQEFADLYNGPGNPREKGLKAVELVPLDMQKMFNRLVQLPADRADLFTDIIKSQGNKDVMAKAIEQYVARKKFEGGNIEIDIPEKDKKEAMAKSVDALLGKFKSEIENARSLGRRASTDKWTGLSKALAKAIAQAEKGEKPDIGKALAQQHAGVLGRLKKELGSKNF